MTTNIKELLEIPIMQEWAEHTPVVNMSPTERDTFFTRMLACEQYENDQGELWELREAINKGDKVAILDALADCWYFAFQWYSLVGDKSADYDTLTKGNADNDPFEWFDLMLDLSAKVRSSSSFDLYIAAFLHSLTQLANRYNFPLHTAVQRVHTSNLSKRNDQGEFEYNEHGKIIKGKNYVPPVLSDLV